MSKLDSNRLVPLVGSVQLPGDKSILHRGILFAGIANGKTIVNTSSIGRDNFASLRVMSQLGLRYKAYLPRHAFELARQEGLLACELVDEPHCCIELFGQSFLGLRAPDGVLYCGNSGTTARLVMGILAACPFEATIDGDRSLRARPFARIVEPLSIMGAEFSSDRLPIKIRGTLKLKSIEYSSPRASAQVKSAILLAAACSGQAAKVIEPHQSRDHTERVLAAMACRISQGETDDGKWSVGISESQTPNLRALSVDVPGDFSSAAFIMVAASLIPGSSVSIKNVGFNPSRRGLFNVLNRMGANIKVSPVQSASGEEVADLLISYAPLKAVDLESEDVVLSLDEIPIISVAAAFADGVTRIRGASELRVKESDRLAMIASLLGERGFEIEEFPDGLCIKGKPELLHASQLMNSTRVQTQVKADSQAKSWQESHDHRILMSACILNYILSGDMHLLHEEVVETSFPQFASLMRNLRASY